MEKIERTCNRCNHTWHLKVKTGQTEPKEPKNCPRCKSPYYNKPRVRNMELFYRKEVEQKVERKQVTEV